MKKRRLKKPFRITRAISIAGIAAVAFSVPVLAAENDTTKNLVVYELNMTDTDPVSTLESRFLETKSEEGLQLINIDPSETVFEVENLDTTKTGLQTVHVNMTIVTTDDTNTSFQNDYSEDVLVKMVTSKAPQLVLKSGTATVAYQSEFSANSYISYVGDVSGTLPVLKINSNVDTNTEGTYEVTYEAVNKLGYTTEAKLTVTVAKTEEQIAAEQAAQDAAEAERLAQEQAEAEALAQQQAAAASSQSGTLGINLTSGGGYNPYAGGWSNCTWGAWQACYNATGVSLPGWGNAYSWLWQASASGYATGSSAAVGSIMVQSNHVAYVAAVSDDGSQVYVVEGNYNGHYNERWVPASGVQPDGQTVQGYIYVG